MSGLGLNLLLSINLSQTSMEQNSIYLVCNSLDLSLNLKEMVRGEVNLNLSTVARAVN
jgi:hypothetical protein